MAHVSISVSSDVADELRKLAAQFTIQTGKRRTFSDLIMQGIILIRRDSQELTDNSENQLPRKNSDHD